MTELDRKDTLLVGVGSPHGDDQVGWRVVELIQNMLPELTSMNVSSPLELIDSSAGFHQLIVCDACQTGGAPGSVHRWTWPITGRHETKFTSTHGVDLITVLGLADTLDRLPGLVTIYGIEIESPCIGQQLSPAIETRLPEIARTVVEHARLPLSKDGEVQTNAPRPGKLGRGASHERHRGIKS